MVMSIVPAVVFLTACLVNVITAIPTRFVSRDDPANLTIPGPAKLITKCTKPNTVALTFDDGPYIWQPQIVAALDAAGAKGTFFVNGNNYGCIYSDTNIQNLRDTMAKGHMIASHTWAHLHLPTLSLIKLESEFDRTTLALQRILGITPAFMRPPFGEYDNQVLAVAGVRGMNVVNWDFDDGDSTGSSAKTSENDYAKVANKHPSSILTLNHETYKTTVQDVLPYALKAFKDKGYDLVTVADCLEMDPYQNVEEPGTKDSTWTC